MSYSKRFWFNAGAVVIAAAVVVGILLFRGEGVQRAPLFSGPREQAGAVDEFDVVQMPELDEILEGEAGVEDASSVAERLARESQLLQQREELERRYTISKEFLPGLVKLRDQKWQEYLALRENMNSPGEWDESERFDKRQMEMANHLNEDSQAAVSLLDKITASLASLQAKCVAGETVSLASACEEIDKEFTVLDELINAAEVDIELHKEGATTEETQR